jgi:hypothetical protein
MFLKNRDPKKLWSPIKKSIPKGMLFDFITVSGAVLTEQL